MRKLLLGTVLGLASATVLAQVDFDVMDVDGDGSISRDEYYGSAGDIGIYSRWDANQDDLIDENEFGETGFDTELFSDWDADADGFLNDDEFYDNSFAYYDENEDGHWDDGEWDDAGDAGFWDV